MKCLSVAKPTTVSLSLVHNQTDSKQLLLALVPADHPLMTYTRIGPVNNFRVHYASSYFATSIQHNGDGESNREWRREIGVDGRVSWYSRLKLALNDMKWVQVEAD
ncbi:unnamed protein product [Protopolystoma xenopodis]|uniref:Uncharacterized protein n=1 Tax=Protopolystoma xenopodis TaxID=117903 RepID=A0A448X495_9PLAT|nr:unnamed protein product [Protopolystoma xenopodis]